ncbi:MAG TPA: methyltransferase [Nitrospira sp.]|nr:methyltransferase [Nitrospira sp.]
MPEPDITSLPPHAQLVQMGTAHWVSHILYVAAKLSLADHLAKGPARTDDLAAMTNTHSPSLGRLLRTLGHLGLVTEDGAGRFTLTLLGAALKNGAPGSARAAILTLASPIMTQGWGHLLESVQTGKPGLEQAMGMPIFDWLARHPEEASLFSETMVSFHGAESSAVAAAYDFSDMNTIVDVGGATGNLLAAILSQYPKPRGILYDLPHVVRDAPALLQSRGVADRVTIESGSFFDCVPTSCDAYLLSHIIHDWTEARCLTILGHCRRALTPAGRVLIIEMVLPEDNTPHPGKMLDMMMLVGPGGQERTIPEYRQLLDKAGLRLTKVVPTDSAVSIVEAMSV